MFQNCHEIILNMITVHKKGKTKLNRTQKRSLSTSFSFSLPRKKDKIKKEDPLKYILQNQENRKKRTEIRTNPCPTYLYKTFAVKSTVS